MRSWRRHGGHGWVMARLVAAALGLVLLALPWPAHAASPLAGKTIVVDPGHGGVDTGAIANGVQEKDVTLPIGLDVGALLGQLGAHVVYTRTSDVTVGPPDDTEAGLAARAKLANDAHADAFISIHANSLSDPTYSGVMTFAGTAGGYVDGAHRSPQLVAQSKLLAEDVQKAVQQKTQATDRGVKSADYYVLGNTAMPSILIETGFLTNPTEAARLASPDYQQKIAAGIAQGFAAFFGAVGTTVKETVATTDARFVADLTYPDQSTVAPGQSLLKAWKVANTGTQAWNSSDTLVLQPGSAISGPASEPLPAIPAGADGSVSVPVVVPNQPGAYSATWRLTDPSGNAFGDPLWLSVVVPDPSFQPFWVETTTATTLWNGPDADSDAIVKLAQWTYLQVTAPQSGDRFAVQEPVSKQSGYVDASAVGPSGAPPDGYTPPVLKPPFTPFWVETTQATALKSGAADPSASFGNIPQWTFLKVLAPQTATRLYVWNPSTGGTAYVDAATVGPSGPPPASAGGQSSADTNTTSSAVASTTSSAVASSSNYTVKPGDSLYAIARHFHVSVDALLQANGMGINSMLLAGQTLQLPAGVVIFHPFWVENFAAAPLWSGTDGKAQRFGTAPLFTPMQVLAPAVQGRYLVKVWTTGGIAYVDGNVVGPAGPPQGAS